MIKTICAKWVAFKSNEEGATAIEYGLIAGGISLAIVAGVFAFGDQLETLFDTMSTAMEEATDNVGSGDAE